MADRKSFLARIRKALTGPPSGDIDYARLAAQVDASEVAEHVEIEVDYSEIEVDYAELSEHVCTSEVAEYVDTEEVARHVEIDSEEVAQHVLYAPIIDGALEAIADTLEGE